MDFTLGLKPSASGRGGAADRRLRAAELGAGSVGLRHGRHGLWKGRREMAFCGGKGSIRGGPKALFGLLFFLNM